MSWRFATRTEPRPNVRWWVSAGVMAATAVMVAYFFDAERGQERRSRFAQRTRALLPGNLTPTVEPYGGASGGWPQEAAPDADSED